MELITTKLEQSEVKPAWNLMWQFVKVSSAFFFSFFFLPPSKNLRIFRVCGYRSCVMWQSGLTSGAGEAARTLKPLLKQQHISTRQWKRGAEPTLKNRPWRTDVPVTPDDNGWISSSEGEPWERSTPQWVKMFRTVRVSHTVLAWSTAAVLLLFTFLRYLK